MTTEQKIEHLLAFLGALVPLMSALASLINHKVRQAQEAGEDVSTMLLHAGSVLNVGAVNLDKAMQFAKLAKQAKGAASEDQG
jgi:hypothetical protein